MFGLEFLLPAALGFLGQQFGAQQQQGNNMELARYTFDRQQDMQWAQNRYNEPASQMSRYQAAGLNPALVYSQGNPGNQSAPVRFPDVQPGNFQQGYADLIPKLMQYKLMESQVDLTQQKVLESGVKQDLQKAQRDLVRANPYMKEEYVSSLVTQLSSAARIKEQEANFLTSSTSRSGTTTYSDVYADSTNGMQRMAKEMDLLEQKFNLGVADQQVKAQILRSKEFQNALQDIQLKWMRDKEITPQHIYQGIMILLGKLMR